MDQFVHSVTLEERLCNGCTNCIKRCPTQAIRVRAGKAVIAAERCIDCGECIRLCPHRAKRAVSDPLALLGHFEYRVAIVPPGLYVQYNHQKNQNLVLGALRRVGFDEVFEEAAAAELISDATSRILATGSVARPVISSACPAVTRLIRVRFPELIDHVLPLVPPMELAARMARRRAAEKTGLAPEAIGCIALVPCPAKVTMRRAPVGSSHSALDGAVSITEIYPRLLAAMNEGGASAHLATAGAAGLAWAASGGEAACLAGVENHLVADGMENITKVLEDLEDEKYEGIDFVELRACAGGCLGGSLQLENPYIARTKLRRMQRSVPGSYNRLPGGVPTEMLWDTDLTYAPVLELGATRGERFERYNRMQTILKSLPGLDCGACGAPSCEALAEDVVRGEAAVTDCALLRCRQLEAKLRAKENAEEGSGA